MGDQIVEKKPGFKKTKLGWIPEDWEVAKFNDLCLNKGQYGINASAVNFSEQLPAYLRITDIDDEGNFSKAKKVSVDDINYKNFILSKGDIVFVRTGATVGKTYLYEKKDGELVFAGFLIKFTPNKVCLDKKYLKYYTQTVSYWNWVRITSFRSGQPGINEAEYGEMLLPLAPLPEQKAIANCLSTWDTAITNLDALIKAKQQLKKGLMQQLLSGEKRLPGFEGSWEDLHFSDISERVNRKNIEADDTVVTISAQRGFVLQEDYFNKRVASDTLLNYTLVHNGEYCYNKSYSKGYPMGAFKRLDDFEKAVVTTLYICFSLKDNVYSDFMNQYFEAGKMIPGLMRIAQEGGRAHGLLNISLPDFFNLPVTLPKLEEQTAIAQVLNTADQEINLLTAQRKQLQLQKKGLMQQLLTGKKRLNTNG